MKTTQTLTGHWLNKLWDSHPMEYYTAVKNEPYSSMDKSQKYKLKKKKVTEIYERHTVECNLYRVKNV